MKFIENPPKNMWEALCTRPTFDSEVLKQSVSAILDDVKRNGDSAIQRYTKSLDGVALQNFQVSKETLIQANVPDPLKQALQTASETISRFHLTQKVQEERIETARGVECWRRQVPIERVGLYIPGGSAPLFSTILMLGIPAKIAGCKELILCTPPRPDGTVDPAILYTANLVGIRSVFSVGGAQAIAGMSFGTESIPKVDKIFGPGNQYVTMAKSLVQFAGTAIDMPAGPSEVLIVADDSANPEFVASDLLSQAEHGADSQVILVSNSRELMRKTKVFLESQLQELPRKKIAKEALQNSRFVFFNSLETCIEFSNFYAPEHLILATESCDEWIEKISNAGSVFLGNLSCESAGDYASGTNHTLPTNGFARSYSGVSVDSFVKNITFQKVSENGIRTIGAAVEILAEAEGLQAHKQAMVLRINSLKSSNNNP